MTSNIIIFGETGAGKSSIVNMLAGADVAATSNATQGCTFETSRVAVKIAGRAFNIFDTAGLNEGDPHTLNKVKAVRQLYQLLISLAGGVNLLLFVMRAPRIKESHVQNWKIFHDIICNKQVPIGVIVTGLENESNMDEWWTRNGENFERRGMQPGGHACITAIRGKKKGNRYLFEEEYAQSRRRVEQLILQCALFQAWNVPRVRWFVTTGILCWRHAVMNQGIMEIMAQVMSEEDAKEFAKELENVKRDESLGG